MTGHYWQQTTMNLRNMMHHTTQLTCVDVKRCSADASFASQKVPVLKLDQTTNHQVRFQHLDCGQIITYLRRVVKCFEDSVEIIQYQYDLLIVS